MPIVFCLKMYTNLPEKGLVFVNSRSVVSTNIFVSQIDTKLESEDTAGAQVGSLSVGIGTLKENCINLEHLSASLPKCLLH